ncbi:hypothetical protein BRADI_4g38014v3 [Brachypodium distachyon]|uniref:Uncharacterized protein n=1 Tax=Brachypodium distachyon TaxID=15368 RepID=A0A0Q3HDE3_BRADI|nr:hypothetical protein BRADI_4g38014v3 [Brachypodium distachyon]
MPHRIHVRSQSLRCVLLRCCMLEEFVVVDAPLLQRLFLSDLRCAIGRHHVRVRIACSAPNLRVLGYLDPRVHELQIADTVIKHDTMESPSTVVRGVKTLALKVNFGVLGQVQMLVSYLRCFPNVETLHIESVLHGPSVTTDESTPEHHANFWQNVSPVKCLRSRVKKMVLHKIQGDPNESEFLKFIAGDARELQSLLVLPHEEIIISSMDKANEMIDKFECPRFRAWASRVLLVLPGMENVLRSSKAFDITVDDPFF